MALSIGRFLSRASNLRPFSSSAIRASSVETSIDSQSGMATLVLNNAPANTLSTDFTAQIVTAVKAAEADNAVRGLLITSALGSKGIFSAGLELSELAQVDETKFRRFWDGFRELYFALYGAQLPTAVAINGHAPAGGCFLAACCDYRVMLDSPKIRIGLNESLFGLVAPKWVAGTYVNVLGQRHGERHVMRGTLHKPNEALEIGLVDELAANEDEAVAKCLKQLEKAAMANRRAYGMTKHVVRGPFLEAARSDAKQDTDNTLKFVSDEGFQSMVNAYLATVRQKNK